MAWYKVEGEKLTAIADKIRSYTGGKLPIKLDAMPLEIQNLRGLGYQTGLGQGRSEGYNIGKADGITAGIAEGIAQGKRAEYDRFWDTYQQNGSRVNYTNAFCIGWTDEIFAPKYDIVAETCSQMFLNTQITDLAQCLKNAGICLDTSKAKNFSYMFNYATAMVEVPHLDLCNATSISYLFNGCSALRKASITFAENKLTSYSSVFSGCRALEELTVAGVIDIPLSFSASAKLSEASVQSVVDALKDLTGQAAKTLTLHPEVGSRLTDGQKAAITAKNWTLVY